MFDGRAINRAAVLTRQVERSDGVSALFDRLWFEGCRPFGSSFPFQTLTRIAANAPIPLCRFPLSLRDNTQL